MNRAAGAVTPLVLLLLAAALVTGLLTDWNDEEPADAAVTVDASARQFVEQSTPSQVMRAGVRGLQGSESVRVRLTTRAVGETPATRFDVTIVDGTGCFGTLSIDDGSTVEFSVVGGTDYLRTDAEGWSSFLRLGDRSVSAADARSFGRLYAGTWVSTESAAPFCDLLDDLPLDGRDALAEDGFTEVDGAPAVRLRLTSTDGKGSAVVGLDEPRRLLSFSGDGATARFSDFDEDTEVPRPSASETLTLSSLG